MLFFASSAARLLSRHSPAIRIGNSSRFMTSESELKIKNLIKENPVLVFMKGDKAAPQCGFSKAVVQILKLQGVDEFKTVNVLEDAEMRSGIKDFNNWPTIPQVFIKGEFIGGTDILIQMHKSGDLEELLIKEGIVKDEI